MYTLDAKLATEADNTSAFLTEAGAHSGKFTRAEKLVSAKTGAHGVGLTFETDNGQSCRFDLWTMNADQSQKYYGLGQLNAIMTCMGVKNLEAKTGEIERWNFQTRQREKAQGYIFPELLDKPIGIVFQRAEYEKMEGGYSTGELGWRLEFLQAYRAADRFTASEIIGKITVAQKLEKTLSTLKDKLLPANKRPKSTVTVPVATPLPAPASAGFIDPDEDIPF